MCCCRLSCCFEVTIFPLRSVLVRKIPKSFGRIDGNADAIYGYLDVFLGARRHPVATESAEI